MKYAWQRQTKDFAHTKADQYSSLVFDNRGVGESDKPTVRYSTSEMAKDIIELLDHIGWTEQRDLHIIGISMGGMIAQELVRSVTLKCVIPWTFLSHNASYPPENASRMQCLPSKLDAFLRHQAKNLEHVVRTSRPAQPCNFPSLVLLTVVRSTPPTSYPFCVHSAHPASDLGITAERHVPGNVRQNFAETRQTRSKLIY